jgi:hypothetical protein
LGSKIDELTSTTDIEQLVQEVVLYLFVISRGSSDVESLILLDIASTKAEIFLPSPQAIHEYIVRGCVIEDIDVPTDISSTTSSGLPTLFEG